VLIAHDLKPMMMSAIEFLQRADIAIRTATSNEALLRTHIERSSNLIVTHPALPGMSCKTLVDIIRRGETLKKVSILLLCDSSPLQQELARQCNANAVLTRPVDTALFSGKVQQLLDVPERHSYRVLLNIAFEGMHDKRPVMCHSENISAGGMLIRTREAIAPGNQLACSFYLPDGHRVSADCAVVRAFKKEPTADMTHYGLSFQACTPDTREAIASFVARESKRQGGYAPSRSA
jgi:DNA-binding response OmpR family regulator